MRRPTSTHPEGWLNGWLPSSESRGLSVLVGIAAVGGVIAAVALSVAEDPRPLDLQLSSAVRESASTLAAWEPQLSRGLQVSLRAVADGRDAPSASPAAAALARPATLKPASLQTPR